LFSSIIFLRTLDAPTRAGFGRILRPFNLAYARMQIQSRKIYD